MQGSADGQIGRQEPSGETRTVLLVDDDDDTRATLEELLHDNGYLVASARNGREAQNYLWTQPRPSCMVLDLWMPVMDGWALAAEIRNGRLPGVPMMVITAAESYWGYPIS